MKDKFFEVAPAIPLQTRQTFTYRSQQTIQPWSIVTVPFGPRSVQAVVIKTNQVKPPYPTKDISSVITEGAITPQQSEFASWLSHTMHGGLGFTLRLFFPPKKIIIKSTSKKQTRHTQEKPYIVLEGDTKKRYQALRELSRQMQKKKKQILILVPEISHIHLLDEAFRTTAKVMPYFAGQPAALKAATWQAVQANEPVIVVGTQKALFLPWHDLGLVILEQAQYSTHKLWDQYPRLDNRYGAQKLADIHAAMYVVSGSSPSLAMQAAIHKKEVTILQANPRYAIPHVITHTFEDKKARLALPSAAATKIRQSLNQKQRLFLLYNKRGAWQSLRCRRCHNAIRCSECGVVALVDIKAPTKKSKKKSLLLICRHCSRPIPIPSQCPSCKHTYLSPSRIGGQTMESILSALNPSQAITRLDADSLAGMSREQINARIKKHPIMIGTSAALTHLEGEVLDHVYWLFPEDALLYPDVRSAERSFLLLSRLSQLSKDKKVTLVTRQPQLLADTIAQKPNVFMTTQLKERERLSYPPFTDLVRLSLSRKKQSQGKSMSVELKKRLGTKGKVRGPYQSIAQSKEAQAQTHILLAGQLPVLAEAYQGLTVDTVDVAPDRII